MMNPFSGKNKTLSAKYLPIELRDQPSLKTILGGDDDVLVLNILLLFQSYLDDGRVIMKGFAMK